LPGAVVKQSAGVLLYRRGEQGLEVLLAHPGGPFFAKKDAGAWSLPKGQPESGEALIACALREFEEEIGVALERDALTALGEVTQAGGKRVHAWACEGDFDGVLPATSTVELEWPPKSGRTIRFPEIDRAEFFALPEARRRMNVAQCVFLDRLEALAAAGST